MAYTFLMELRKRPDFTIDATFSNELGIAYLRKKNFTAAQNELFRACSSKDPKIILNTAIFLDRYRTSKNNARNFYSYYLNIVGNKPADAAKRELVEARMRQL